MTFHFHSGQPLKLKLKLSFLLSFFLHLALSIQYWLKNDILALSIQYWLKMKAKYGKYDAEAEYSGALLFPFCLDFQMLMGPLYPLISINYKFILFYIILAFTDAGRLGRGVDPKAGVRAVFEDGKAPRVGQLEISVEEGMIQKLNRRVVADAPVGGLKLLDQLGCNAQRRCCYESVSQPDLCTHRCAMH